MAQELGRNRSDIVRAKVSGARRIRDQIKNSSFALEKAKTELTEAAPDDACRDLIASAQDERNHRPYDRGTVGAETCAVDGHVDDYTGHPRPCGLELGFAARLPPPLIR